MPVGHHVRDGVAAAAAHADHLDDGALAVCVHQFKHVVSSLRINGWLSRLLSIGLSAQKLPWNQARMRSSTPA